VQLSGVVAQDAAPDVWVHAGEHLGEVGPGAWIQAGGVRYVGLDEDVVDADVLDHVRWRLGLEPEHDVDVVPEVFGWPAPLL